ncbi:MAG: hypothetical protein QOH06_4684 [Acidobacteriota bacterium]|jgi:hypothetical protein|nr:hypothetical protein [Acidobacteriota bacterium]
MSDPFDALLFPRKRHLRGPDPGPFSYPQAYKAHLRGEFLSKCVYCRVPDGLKGYEGFGVDHYLPASRFPALAVAWSNLFYACNVCNTWKSDCLSTPERFLPNPCEHRMADHLQYRGAEVETFTAHGEWLADLLHLDERRRLREFILSALGRFLRARIELLGDLVALEDRIEIVRSAEERSFLEIAIQETGQELERVDRQIELLTGEPLFSG